MSYIKTNASIARSKPLEGTISPIDSEMRKTLRLRLARRVHGMFQSRKMGLSLAWRHVDERDLFSVLELDPEIYAYEVVTERVVLHGATGGDYTHIPSLKAETLCGPIVLDALPLHMPCRKAVVAAVQAVYARENIRYRALTGAQIRVEPRFSHVIRVLQHRRTQPDREAELQVQAAIALWPGLPTVGQVVDHLQQVPNVRRAICSLILQHAIGADLSALKFDDMFLRVLSREGLR